MIDRAEFYAGFIIGFLIAAGITAGIMEIRRQADVCEVWSQAIERGHASSYCDENGRLRYLWHD